MCNTGCCGGIIRLLLSILNIIFLIIGIVIFVFASLVQWSNNFLREILEKSEELQVIIDLSGLSTINIILFCLGGFIIVLSFVGLIGACCASKVFLIIYEIIIVILFLAHLAVVITVAVMSSKVEDSYRKSLNSTLNDVNIKNDTAKCAAMRVLSEVFTCCGVYGPNDFTNEYSRQTCCRLDTPAYYKGCADTAVKVLKDDGIYFVIIPNSVILAFEFLIILIVPFLISRIDKNKKDSKWDPTYSKNTDQVAYKARY